MRFGASTGSAAAGAAPTLVASSDNVSTQSGIKEFEPDARAELVARIRRRVEQHGGTITAHLLAVLTVARVRHDLRTG